jgi:hypothetical protein
VIELLNACFVCVYVSNDHIPGDEGVAAKEKAERQRIYAEFSNSKFGSGTVSPYLLTSDAKMLNRLDLTPACKGDNLLRWLEKTVADLKLTRGKPVVKPAPQAAAPTAPEDALRLHLTARKLTPRHSWNEFPSEDWIILTREQQAKLMPPPDARAGTAWDVDRNVCGHILTHFFPQTESCTSSEAYLLSEKGPYRHKLTQAALKAMVVSVKDGVVRARLDGALELNHAFYPNHADYELTIRGGVVGYVDYHLGKKKVTALRLVTTDRTGFSFGGSNTPIGVAVKSVP